jgi:hypothetical protein
LNAQAPSALEQHLQGRQAKVLLDMPGDDSGVDVRPREAAAVNQQVHRDRLAKYGVALRQGQSVSVTLVKLKGDHIEFHLNGGGFTNLQLWELPGYDSAHWGTTKEERELQSRMSGTRDQTRRRRLKSDYDRLRQRRVRPLRERLELERRAQHGSRFNIWFGSDREASRVTAEELTAILRPYLEIR